MTQHLSTHELLAAAESSLAGARAAHADECAACGREVAALRAAWQAVRHDHVPEPSPLFWDHLSNRIRVATAEERLPGSASWWRHGWPSVAALAAVAGALALIVSLGAPRQFPSAHGPAAVSDGPASSTAADASWESVVQMAAALSTDDVHLVVASAPEYAPTVSELSPAERAAFLRLLESDAGGESR
jgi:hypothetical protein